MRSPWLLGGLALALAAAALVISIIALVIQPGSANPEEKVELHPADREWVCRESGAAGHQFL